MHRAPISPTSAVAHLSDQDLASRIAQRDDHAFEMVMRRHNRMLYRIARSILRDDADAEEALQEAYLAAYRNIAAFRGAAKLSTWLARIVINESYARLRKRKPAVVVSFDASALSVTEVEAVSDESERPDMAAMRAELRTLLVRKIDELPEQFRTVFVMRDVEELSVEETAACLDVPEATVRTRAFRARALLRESLAREVDVATVSAFGFDGERCDLIVRLVLEKLRQP